MKKNKGISAGPSGLRSRAEEQLKKLRAGDAIPRTEEETQKLLHELQVHQIELEMQNEELRRARAETEAALDRYTELYDFAPVGYFTLDKDGIISSVNLTGAELLATERSRLINKSFNLFIADEDRPVFNVFLQNLFKIKSNESCEVRLQGKGRPPFVHIEARVLIEEQKCHAIVSNITDRRQAEEALGNSNALNKSIIDSSSDCVKILDIEGRLQYMSQGGQLLLGIGDIEKYLNLPYQEFWKGADNKAALEAIHKAQQGKLGTFQGYCPTEDNIPKWWDVAITPIAGADGKPERLLAVSRDITEHKKLEDAQLFLVRSGWLASGEDFFDSLARYLAENLGMDFVCIDQLEGEGLSAQTVAVYFDGKFEDNVSYALKDTPCGDVVGKTICTFTEDVRHLFPRDVVLQDMLAESYVGITLWSSEGQPIGLIAMIGRKPLTDSHLAESILLLVSLRAAGELERRQAEEALKALNKKLQITASKLDIEYKEMESFSYSISHDLRAPLRIIDSMSEIVLNDYHDKLDEEGRRLLDSIRRHTKRMDKLVLALLDLSKVGRQEIRLDEIDMEKMAALIVDDLKTATPERNITVTLKDLLPAYGDITLIRQVLTNLLTNAVKFTKHKDVAVIAVGGRREDSEYVYYVKDNGAGFDMEYSNKLFGVFQRLHSEKEFQGIGIGLSIVRRIIERHGGRVWAEGRRGEGAVFYFSLPGKAG